MKWKRDVSIRGVFYSPPKRAEDEGNFRATIEALSTSQYLIIVRAWCPYMSFETYTETLKDAKLAAEAVLSLHVYKVDDILKGADKLEAQP